MKPALTTRRWALLLGGAFAVLALAALLLQGLSGPGAVARIEVDGQVVRRVDLATVTSGETFTIDTPWGSNAIEVRPGGIRVADADCPDRVCVNKGWLTGGYAPIVCLPHRLVITLEAGGGDDGAPDVVTG